MKIIDLLNKIANEEELPNAIKFNDIIYKKADIGKDYYNFTINKWFFKDIFDASGVNLEVEILKENKELKKIEKLNNVGNSQDLGEFEDKQQLNNHILKDKINEIIDYLKSKGE